MRKISKELFNARLEALEEVTRAREAITNAKADYKKALERASSLDIPNSAIAKRLGVSETAVRLFLKRNQK